MESNGQWVPDTPENTYVLAVYQSEENDNDNQVQPDNEAALQQRSPSSSVAKSTVTTTEVEVSNERKYLVQRWENGDICEETGQPRKVEVQVRLFESYTAPNAKGLYGRNHVTNEVIRHFATKMVVPMRAG